MSDLNGSSVKTKNITFGSVLGWAFGILIGIPAILDLFTNPGVAIVMLLAALVAFPPSYHFIKKKTHISLSKGLRVTLFLVLCIIAGIMLGNQQGKIAGTTLVTAPATVTQTAPAAPAIKITATKLSDDYKANEIAADAKYKGNLLEVTGSVSDIGTDILNNPYVTFDTGEYSTLGVQCMFSKDDQPELAKLSKGQTITVQGTVDGGGKILNVLLDACVIVK